MRALILGSGPLSIADTVPASRAARSPFLPSFILTALQQASQLAPSLGPILVAPRRVLDGAIARTIEADGMVRFFGPGDPIDPDCDTIACAAVALAGEGLDCRALMATLPRFRRPDGFYASYVSGDGLQYTWIDPDGSKIAGIDRTVQANILFAQACLGQPSTALAAFLARDLGQSDPWAGSRDYPYPSAYPYCALRALGAAGHRLAVADLQRISDGGLTRAATHGPLTLAHMLSLLCHPDAQLEMADAVAQALLLQQSQDGGWAAEPFCVGGFRSEALSTAEALLALCRYAHRRKHAPAQP